LSNASAQPTTVSIEIIDPTGTSHVLTGGLPLTGSQTLEMGKGSHRFDVRATQSGDDITVIGELHELRGNKDKVVRVANITLPAQGSSRSKRLSWGAPKGATVPDGLSPDLLAWHLVAEWDAPAASESAPESAEDTAPAGDQRVDASDSLEPKPSPDDGIDSATEPTAPAEGTEATEPAEVSDADDE
jgi:hypothetical protein